MKKIFFICFIITIALLHAPKTYGEETHSYRNYISLENWEITNNRSLEMKHSVLLKGGYHYTFVSFEDTYEFLHDDFTSLEYYDILVSLQSNQGLKQQSFYYTVESRCAYVEFFFPDDTLFKIEDLYTYLPPEKDIPKTLMLYRGQFHDFKGVRSYHDTLDSKIFLENHNITIYTDVNDPVYPESLTQHLYHAPDENWDITILEDTYSTNTKKLGSYLYQISILTTNKKRNTISFTIHVIDITSPIISGPDTIVFNMSQYSVLTKEDILSKYTAYDNFDQLITSTLYILEEQSMSYDMSLPSQQQIHIGCQDSSGNIIQKEITIAIQDDIPPTILSDNITLYLSKNYPVSNNSLTNFIIKDNFTTNPRVHYIGIDQVGIHAGIPGEYLCSVSATDDAKNITTHNFKIIVVDDLPLNIYTSNLILNSTKHTPLKESDFTKIISNNLKKRNLSVTDLIILSNTYQEQSKENVIIKYSYCLEGETIFEEASFTINVSNTSIINPNWWYLATIIPIALIGGIFFKRHRKKNQTHLK